MRVIKPYDGNRLIEPSPDLKQVLNWEFGSWRYQKVLNLGILRVQGVIDEEMSFEFGQDLIYLTKIKSPMVGGYKKPIWILLNSRGGDIVAGLAIYDMIRAVVEAGADVNIVGKGIVASMAAVILQAGSKRFSFPHTQFLVHEIKQYIFELIEGVSAGRERVEENERINFIIMSIIAERVGIELKELTDLSKKRDCWFDASGAKALGKFGLIDEIITTLPF